MRLRHRIAAVCTVVPVLAAVAAVGMLYDITFAGTAPVAGAATAGCDVGQVPVNVPGLDPEQTRNVQVIIAEGTRLHVPVFGQEVAVATARQESTLHNLTGGNLDSVGLFQQRASWGTYTQRHDPVWAADAFYQRLLAVRGWQAMSLTVAAQSVQHSGLPGAYAAWTALARQAVAGTAGTAATCQVTVSGGYVNPFADRRWSPNRIDQGVDYGPSVPLPMLAIGDGIVLASSTTAGWPGGCWLAYRITSGDHAGDVVFVAEHLTGLLPVGTVVRAGQRVATALPGDPWTESGFASKDGSSVATPYPVGAVDGYNTEGGKAFARFLIALGAKYPGLSGENPGPGTTRPPN